MACRAPAIAAHPTGGLPRTTPAGHEPTVHSREQSCPPRKRPTNERHICARASNDLPGAATRGPMATLCKVGTAVEHGTNGRTAGSGGRVLAARPGLRDAVHFDPLPL